MSKWPLVPLSEVAKPISRPIAVEAGQSYRTLGVKWWGEGAYERQTIDGSQTAAKTLSLVHNGDLIINKIWVRHGSTAIATDAVDGCAASNEFPTFELDQKKIHPRWMHWLTKANSFWRHCDALSMGTSGKNRIKPEKFLTISIPLPALTEQNRLVERIDALVAKIEETQSTHDDADRQSDFLLMSAYHQIAGPAPRSPFGEVAPLIRRPAAIDPAMEYPGVSVRSFGRGTFHNPPLLGSEITWEKPQLVKEGDILVSNIKAWEGAIAVAESQDDSRFGSHRYLTFVPMANVATARFLCFHLLTPEGLHYVGEASPGSADRNRTLGSKAMLNIPVPVPTYNQQLWFNELLAKVSEARTLRRRSAAVRDAMLPAILNRAFTGQL